jgi:hypothetical protein
VFCFGPTKAAAKLEAKYRTFTNVEEAVAYLESLMNIESGSDCQVVKASGLAAGKGVLRYPTTKEETIAAAQEIILDKTVGTAVDTCVIESFLTGPKASWHDLSLLVVFSNSCKIHCDNGENLPLIDGENLPLTQMCLELRLLPLDFTLTFNFLFDFQNDFHVASICLLCGYRLSFMCLLPF